MDHGVPAIRDALPGDIDQITELFRRSSLSNDADRASIIANPEVLEFDPVCVHENRTRIAIQDGRVVGFATTAPNGDAAELDDLFVDPDWMRRGIASDLISDVERRARDRGATRIEVTANTHAMAFYQHVGFVQDGEAQTEGGPQPRMHLDLAP